MDKIEDSDYIEERRKLRSLKNECESLEKEIKHYAASTIELRQSFTSISGNISALRASVGEISSFLQSAESHVFIFMIKSIFSNSFSPQSILDKRKELTKIELDMTAMKEKKLRIKSSLEVTEAKRNELLGIYDQKKKEYQKVSSSIPIEEDTCVKEVNVSPVVKVRK